MSDIPPATSYDLEALLAQTVQRANTLIPFSSGGIALYDAESQVLLMRIYQRFESSVEDDPPISETIIPGNGIVGHAAESMQAIVVSEFADPNQATQYEVFTPGTRSAVAAPMRFDGKLHGVFLAESIMPNAYQAQQLAIVQTLADQASMIIHMARLNRMLSRRYERLSDSSQDMLLRTEVSRLASSDEPLEALLPKMAQRVAAIAGGEACAVTLWDKAELRPIRLAAYGLDLADYLSGRRRPAVALSLTQRIVRTGETVIINDAQSLADPPTPLIQEYEIQSLLAMPLVARGRPIGAIFLINMTPGTTFSRSDADKITTPLDQIALAIDNRLLLQNMQERLTETSALLEIAARAASSLHLDEMLSDVLKFSRQMLGVTVGAFFLYNRHANTLELHPSGHFGVPDDMQGIRFPVNQPGSHIAIVFTSGTPYFSNDVQNATQDAHPDYMSLLMRLVLQNLLIAPLRVQDEPMGVFMVGNKQGDFSKADSKLLMAMGSHVAAALRNNELLSDTRQRLRETEALQQIAAITSSTLNIDDMLERAVREAAELMEVEGAILMMPDPENNALIPHARSCYGTAQQMAFEPMLIDVIEAGHIVRVFRTGRPYTNRRPPSEPGIQWRNVITFPLSTRNHILGTLSLIDRQMGEFEDLHIDLARAIASQIATSMDNAQLFTAERQRADLMALINKISQELTATLSLSELMRKVVRAIHERLGYSAVTISLLDDNALHLTVRSSLADDPTLVAPEGTSVSVSDGYVGQAMQSGETQVIEDKEKKPELVEPTRPGHITGLIVPLRYGTRILGVIEARVSQRRRLDQTDTLAMETLAAQVSVAIENARLWDQARRRLLEQGIVHQIGQDLSSILDYSELVNAVVKHMTRALDTSLCVLTTYNDDTGNITVDAEYRLPDLEEMQQAMPTFIGQRVDPNTQVLLQRAIRTRRQVIVTRSSDADTETGRALNLSLADYLTTNGIYAELALPMIAGDRVIGCVLWLETRAMREFSGSDVRLAQTLTTQAAIAIENARLFRQAQRQAHEQTLLRRVAIGLSMMPDTGSMLSQFAYEVTHAIPVNNVAIAIRRVDEPLAVDASHLTTCAENETLIAHLGWHHETTNTLMSALESGTSLVLASHITERPSDLNPYFQERRVTILLTPIMRRRREIIGIIEASFDMPDRIIEPDEIQILEALANQVSIAYDNISYHERELRRLSQMEKLQVTSQNIAGQLRTTTLHDSIVTEAAQIFNVPAVGLAMREGDQAHFHLRATVGLSDDYARGRRARYLHFREFRILTPPQLFTDDPEPEQMELFFREGIINMAVIPLNKAGQQLGVLILYGKGKPLELNEEEKDLALLFASQAAIALENAALFQALEERAVELAKANRLKSEFLARVSHELRTPMNSINVFSEMLLRNAYGVVNEKQADRIERILRNGKNLLALIDDLLDLSKIDAGKMELLIEAVNLRDEVVQTLANLESQATARGLYLKLDAPEVLPRIQGDSMRLRQIVTNLLGNALKFTKTGGITVRIAPYEHAGISYVATSVIDTGIGIRKDDQTIIFDEFRQADGSTTREYGGTGLGLAITRRLVEMMKGRVWVESEAGKGSTFTFIIPVAQPNL